MGDFKPIILLNYLSHRQMYQYLPDGLPLGSVTSTLNWVNLFIRDKQLGPGRVSRHSGIFPLSITAQTYCPFIQNILAQTESKESSEKGNNSFNKSSKPLMEWFYPFYTLSSFPSNSDVSGRRYLSFVRKTQLGYAEVSKSFISHVTLIWSWLILMKIFWWVVGLAKDIFKGEGLDF